MCIMPILYGHIVPLSPPSPSPSIAMFSLTGDPYPNLHMLSPWLDHQLVWFSEKDSCLFLRAAIDKQHRTCSISFHSALSKYRMCNVHHSHPHTLTPSHPHTLTLSRPHILTPSHLYTCTCDSVRHVHF